MRLLLAAYDPAHQSPDGGCWVWWHPDLLADVRNSFYYDIAAKNLPKNPNELSPAYCYGGWAAVNDDWACWYRFLDGGRDMRGRPGRFVLLCAFCRRQDNVNTNGFAVLDSPPFQNLAKVASSVCPVPTPETLELQLDLPEVVASSRSPLNAAGGRTQCSGADASTTASSLCANLAPSYRFHCTFARHSGQTVIGVDIAPLSVFEPAGRQVGMVPPKDKGVASQSTVVPPPEPRTSGAAVWSLIFGILSFCTGGLTAIPSIILGVLGLRSVRRSGGRMKGNRLAIAGVVTSMVGLLLWLLVVLVGIGTLKVYRTVHSMFSTPPSVESLMKTQAAAICEFAENNGRLPLASEYPEMVDQYLKDMKRPSLPVGRKFVLNAAVAGMYLDKIREPEQTVLLFEANKSENSVGGKELLRPLTGRDSVVIAFVDGHVESLKKEEVDKLIWQPGENAESLILYPLRALVGGRWG